jgi:hypothetical protein
MLADEGLDIAYSTLTRLIRENDVRQSRKRSGVYEFGPGQEMHFDTSPHRVVLGEKKVIAQCASLVLAYSRRIYAAYFPTFTRFDAKVFLTRALAFMDGSCRTCVIDNTSVVVVAGSGPGAIFAPDMEELGRHYGFEFMAHKLGHADRKARVERPFSYIENNFLAGRIFNDWDDLNAQCLAWCENLANKKPKRVLGMSPEQAYVLEKPYIRPLPPYIPPVYDVQVRVVDVQGYVSLETNRYSVPEKFIGKTVEVHKHMDRVMVYHKNDLIAEHRRLLERNTRITAPGHHPPLNHQKKTGPGREEMLLAGRFEALDAYIAILRQKAPGRGTAKLKKLLELERTYPHEAFLQAVETALAYAMTDLSRLETMILDHLKGEYFKIKGED